MAMDNKTLLTKLVADGKSYSEISKILGVSKQRVGQLKQQYNLIPPAHKRRGFWKSTPQLKWLGRTINSKGKRMGVNREGRIALVYYLKDKLPATCPALGIELNYDGGSKHNRENSPSIDRIDSSLGYVPGNVQIISWRANRIKNNATPDELRRIAEYMGDLNHNR